MAAFAVPGIPATRLPRREFAGSGLSRRSLATFPGVCLLRPARLPLSWLRAGLVACYDEAVEAMGECLPAPPRSARDAVLAGHLGVPVAAALDDSLLGLEVDVD